MLWVPQGTWDLPGGYLPEVLYQKSNGSAEAALFQPLWSMQVPKVRLNHKFSKPIHPPLVPAIRGEKRVLPSRWSTQFTAIPLPHHGSSSPCPWRGAFQVPSISKFTGASSILSAHTCTWAQARYGAHQSGDATCLLWESARTRFKADEDDFRRGGEEIGTRVGRELMWPQGLASI